MQLYYSCLFGFATTCKVASITEITRMAFYAVCERKHFINCHIHWLKWICWTGWGINVSIYSFSNLSSPKFCFISLIRSAQIRRKVVNHLTINTIISSYFALRKLFFNDKHIMNKNMFILLFFSFICNCKYFWINFEWLWY